ncbi:MAG: MurR/RpiR family transcriptional regulator [Ruminococcaceae bacterium]|nr:MurR/RpiR family transcriptional regulator [Oscillospiraceae bacterium]
MLNDILKTIADKYPHMSKGHRNIANYIKENYNKAAFMTAAKLAEAVGISESTVVRFAYELGYDGYPQLQKMLQSLARSRLTSVQRIELAEEHLNNSDVLKKVVGKDIDNLRHTLEDISKKDFDKAAEAIAGAKNIYIIGVRSSHSLASFMSFYFNHIFGNVRNVNTTSVSEMFEQIIRIGPGDVLIGVTFPRYSQRTVKAAKYAHESGACVVSITDSASSPIVKYSDVALFAKSDMASFVDSLVAPLSIINALIVAVGLLHEEDLSETFHKLERVWKEYNVYQQEDESE